MKAITILQPYASLLACGAKQYETRSWATSWRGKIAIHAVVKRMTNNDYFGAIFESEVCKYLRQNFFQFDQSPYNEFRWIMDNLDYGAVIATAELVECWLITDNGHTIGSDKAARIETLPVGAKTNIVEGNEILFGDWSPGRYAWEFANMTMLTKPIPARGRQRIWEWKGIS